MVKGLMGSSKLNIRQENHCGKSVENVTKIVNKDNDDIIDSNNKSGIMGVQDPLEEDISDFDTDRTLVIADIDQLEEAPALNNSYIRQEDQFKYFIDKPEFGGLKLKDVMVNKELDKKIEEVILKQDGMWTCKVCGKAAHHKSKLKQHVETHLEGFSHPCPICGKVYRSRNVLRMHTSRDHKNRYSSQTMKIEKKPNFLSTDGIYQLKDHNIQ